MKCFFIVLLISLSNSLCADGEDKGFCPPAADVPKTARAKSTPTPERITPTADPKYAGTVSLRLVISDRGYVCSVQLIRGFDKTADAQAMQAVRTWRFDPSRKNGRPVVVEMIVEVAFRRSVNGELIQEPPNKSAK